MAISKNNNNRKDKVFKKKIRTVNRLNRTLGLLLSGIAFLIYLNTINHDYVLDDFSTIKDNSVTTLGTKAIPDIFGHYYRYGYYTESDGIYRPLSVAMFAFEWSLSPNNPTLNHFVNILLYAFTGGFLFLTLTRLLKNYSVVFAFIITLLFITHPVHTEVVANIKGRDDLLCFLLSFATLYYLLNYVESNSKKKLYVAAALFLCAFLSKETAITMVVAIPLALHFFTDVKKRALIISTLCLLTVAGIFMLLRAYIIGQGATHEVTPIENLLLMSSNASERLATSFKIMGNYLGILFYPGTLLCDYSFNQIPITNFSDISVIITLLVYLAMIIYTVWGFLRKDLLAFGISFYVVTISLFTNIVFIIGVAMAERFLYFASFGFCFALAVVLLRISKSSNNFTAFSGFSDFFSKNKFVLLITVIISFFYSIKSVSRNKDWSDNYTLFNHDLKLSPDNARMHSFLGNEIIKTIAPSETSETKRIALYTQGINELKKSLEIYPDHPDALKSIGKGYFQLDSMDHAEYYFKKALKYNPTDYSELGDFYFAKMDYPNAIKIYKKAIKANPNYLEGYINLGISFGTLKQYAKAINYFNKALEIQPSNALIYYYMSTAYKFKGDLVNCEKYFQKAYQLDPTLSKP